MPSQAACSQSLNAGPGPQPLHPQPPVAVSTSWRRPSSQNSFFLHCDPSSRNAFPPWKGILFSSIFNLFYFLLGLHSQLVHLTVISPPPFFIVFCLVLLYDFTLFVCSSLSLCPQAMRHIYLNSSTSY